MNIPLGTTVTVKPGFIANIFKIPTHVGRIVKRNEPENGKLPYYTLELDNGSTAMYSENWIIAPQYCKCGSRMDEVEFVSGTESCFSCHELSVMEETGIGVVSKSPLGSYVQ